MTGEPRATILVVDDDPTSRILARSHLEQDGHTVIEAEDGLEALEIVGRQKPDLVLLDVDMPRLDGFGTCEGLRLNESMLHTPIVMMTGAKDDEAVETAYGSGATDFVVKPVQWAIVRNRVRYLLRTGEMVAELDESRRMLADAQHLAAMGNWAWEQGAPEMSCSVEFRRMLGFEPGVPVTLPLFQACFPGPSRQRIERQIQDALARSGEYEVACDFEAGAQGMRHAILRIRSGGDDQTARRLVGTLQDVTERHRNESRIRQLAYSDALTTLPNREAFKQHLGEELVNAERRGARVSLFYIDLDDFKRVNDTMGTSMGDLLLRAVGERLVRELGLPGPGNVPSLPGPLKNVSRLGGDEFSLVAAGTEGAAGARAIARRIVRVLATPFLIDGQDVHVTASIGVASYPDNGADVETLLKCAGTAMRHAKVGGKNGFDLFDASMTEGEVRRAVVESGLRNAIARGELEVHYQPQVDTRHRRIDGVEALLRWNSPDLGAVSPGEFIPAAEATRVIVPMGNWVLRSACDQLVRWDSEGAGVPRVAVNVSLMQFVQADFPRVVRTALDESGLVADRLELEITESVLAVDLEHASRMLAELKDIGVHLSIDDFGTGYSSLGHLKRFPVDRLKIDRCFVRDIASDPDDAAIAEAVLGMARSMGLDVVAEGVETPAQLDILRTRGCSIFQGFLFSRAQPADRMASVVREMKWPAHAAGLPARAPQPQILFVDDDPVMRAAILELLSLEEFRVHTLASAEQALEYIARCPVDVIVSDQVMPGMTGVELLSRVRRLAPETVRILMSGRSDRSVLAEAINRGAASRFLEKPVSRDTLCQTLKEVTGARNEPRFLPPIAV